MVCVAANIAVGRHVSEHAGEVGLSPDEVISSDGLDSRFESRISNWMGLVVELLRSERGRAAGYILSTGTGLVRESKSRSSDVFETTRKAFPADGARPLLSWNIAARVVG